MNKILGYNRNIMDSHKSKRPHRKIQRYGQYKTLAERLKAEGEALDAYQKRTHVGDYAKQN